MAIHFTNTKKLFLLDQDGTLYKGRRLFQETIPFLNAIKDAGASYLFITNNSSKSIDEYIHKMAAFGIPSSVDDFYTSANATIDYINKKCPGNPVYLVGTKALHEEFRKQGINLTVDINEAVIAVLSYDTELSYEKLTNICELLKRDDVLYLATNPDLVCPTETGYLPDCGSFALMIEKATGRTPLFLGKPRALFVETIRERYQLKKEDIVIVGDRLYTDVAMGINSDVDTILVLTGEATLEDVENSEYKPTYIVKSVGNIF